MAGEKSLNYRTSCTHDDEIEGLKKLLQLSCSVHKFMSLRNSDELKVLNAELLPIIEKIEKFLSQKVVPQSQSLCDDRHECSLLHHDSPVNIPTPPINLPPIGVFWDMESCQVPKGRSAIAVTQLIRDKFFNGYREAEFIVVCDVQKENNQIIQELNDAQVNLIHVAATCKNAANEKLKQSIRRFADIHGSAHASLSGQMYMPAAIILISGDINFAADLSDLQRKKIYVILLYKKNTSEALTLCANERYDFMELTEPLPSGTPAKVGKLVCEDNIDKDLLYLKLQ